jgi:hypothetical protein
MTGYVYLENVLSEVYGFEVKSTHRHLACG